MSLNLGTVLYVPPPDRYPGANAILANLRNHPPALPLIVYSDHPHDWPELVRLRASPEAVKVLTDKDNKPNRWGLNNAVFMTGLRIARERGFSHVIYLEADCRVKGKGWDARLFEEYFTLGRPCIMAGTLAAYNPCNWSLEAARRWQQLVAGNQDRNMPVATYGWKGAAERHPCCVFSNGAFSVLNMAWMPILFALDNSVQSALNMGPWDMELGMQIWKRFEELAYDVTGMLHSVYSGYGDVLTTEAQRLQWLRDGLYCGVHQIKSEAQP